ncbi:LOW QUALITY PROTEIN: hypothetical protein MXB_4834 [Myxobolus squamalis]|nr:LOW QUALITY PROTEIN: hypothetical protein MXB_4834 [Myxobolus squamalis]
MPKSEYRKQKSFGIPTSKKIDTKRKKEEERQKLDEEAAANLYDDFVTEFQPPPSFEDKNRTNRCTNSSMHKNAPLPNNQTTYTRAHKTKSNLELLNEELKRY